MKKGFCLMAACACVWLAAPASASRTVVLDQVINLSEDMFTGNANGVNLGRGPSTKIEGNLIVEGTVQFKGGHIAAAKAENFYVFSWLYSVENQFLPYSSWSMSLLDKDGNEFGSKKTAGGYPDRYSISVASSDPTEVYGLRYRIAFVGGMGWNFAFNPIAASARYVPGDIFASAVPEPSSWAMMALGFAGLGLAMRRRRAGGAVVAA